MPDVIIFNVNFNSNDTKPNLMFINKAALNALRSNDNIEITKVDRGGQILILDKKSYDDGVKNLINDGPFRLYRLF